LSYVVNDPIARQLAHVAAVGIHGEDFVGDMSPEDLSDPNDLAIIA
jgi:hypothetical protein